MEILSYFFPRKLASYPSPFNGLISVYKFLGRTYIEVGRLTQTGRVVERIFKKAMKHFRLVKIEAKKILLLGLGGGSLVALCNKLYPNAHITAVDIDSVMVEVGRTHFRLNEYKNLSIVVADIFAKDPRIEGPFDLILIDVFRGYEVPYKLGETEFLKYLSSLLATQGSMIFNRLYIQNYIFFFF